MSNMFLETGKKHGKLDGRLSSDETAVTSLGTISVDPSGGRMIISTILLLERERGREKPLLVYLDM